MREIATLIDTHRGGDAAVKPAVVDDVFEGEGTEWELFAELQCRTGRAVRRRIASVPSAVF